MKLDKEDIATAKGMSKVLRLSGKDKLVVVGMLLDALLKEREAAQPKREWVGLTDEEVDECYESIMFHQDIEPTRMCVYLEIEAKLKEKNTQPTQPKAEQEQTSCYCPNCEAMSKQLAAFTYVGFRVVDDSGIPVSVYTFNGETK